MKTLQPAYSKQAEFKNEELLRPDDQLAQWIANVGRALNDLLVAHRRIEQDFAEGSSQGTPEAIYDVRSAATHVWEFAKFLRLAEAYSEGVRDFLKKDLHPPALKVYRQALEALTEPEEGDQETEERSFKEALVRARDQRSHYAKLDTKPIRQAMARLAGSEDEPGIGSLFMGENFKDCYPEFSTQLDYQLLIPHTKKELDPLRKFSGQLSSVVSDLVCFAVGALQSYFAKHPPASLENFELRPPRSVPYPVND
jgi:hypothetical protein